MTTLTAHHPMQLVLGSIVVAEELATKGRQLTLAQLCHDAAVWAVECRDVLREIVCDADYCLSLFDEAGRDGVYTAEEIAAARGVVAEIREEAFTGKIL